MNQVVRTEGTYQIQVRQGTVAAVGPEGPPGPQGEIHDSWTHVRLAGQKSVTANTWTDVNPGDIVNNDVCSTTGTTFQVSGDGTYAVSAAVLFGGSTGTAVRKVRLVMGSGQVIAADEALPDGVNPASTSASATFRLLASDTIRFQVWCAATTTVDAAAIVFAKIGTGPAGQDADPLVANEALDARYANVRGDTFTGTVVVLPSPGSPLTDVNTALWLDGAYVDGVTRVETEGPVTSWKSLTADATAYVQGTAALQPVSTKLGYVTYTSDVLTSPTPLTYGSATWYFQGTFSVDGQCPVITVGSAAAFQFAVGRANDGNMFLRWFPASGPVNVATTKALTKNTIYVIAVSLSWTGSSSVMTAYVDGVQVATITENNPSPNGSGTVHIGAGPLGDYAGNVFQVCRVTGVHTAPQVAAYSQMLTTRRTALGYGFVVNPPTGQIASPPLMWSDSGGMHIDRKPTTPDGVASKIYVDDALTAAIAAIPPSLPLGGAQYAVLSKSSATDYAVEWRPMVYGPSANAPQAGQLPEGALYFGY